MQLLSVTVRQQPRLTVTVSDGVDISVSERASGDVVGSLTGRGAGRSAQGGVVRMYIGLLGGARNREHMVRCPPSQLVGTCGLTEEIAGVMARKNGNAFYEVEILDGGRNLHTGPVEQESGTEQPLLQEAEEQIYVSRGTDLDGVTYRCQPEPQGLEAGKGGKKRPREDNVGAGDTLPPPCHLLRTSPGHQKKFVTRLRRLMKGRIAMMCLTRMKRVDPTSWRSKSKFVRGPHASSTTRAATSTGTSDTGGD